MKEQCQSALGAIIEAARMFQFGSLELMTSLYTYLLIFHLLLHGVFCCIFVIVHLAKDSWCLCKLIHQEGENVAKYLQSGNIYFQMIGLRKQHQKPRISVVRSNWAKPCPSYVCIQNFVLWFLYSMDIQIQQGNSFISFFYCAFHLRL